MFPFRASKIKLTHNQFMWVNRKFRGQIDYFQLKSLLGKLRYCLWIYKISSLFIEIRNGKMASSFLFRFFFSIVQFVNFWLKMYPKFLAVVPFSLKKKTQLVNKNKKCLCNFNAHSCLSKKIGIFSMKTFEETSCANLFVTNQNRIFKLISLKD